MRMRVSPLNGYLAAFFAGFLAVMPSSLLAAQPTPKGIGFQTAASPVAEQAFWFHDKLLLPIITVITIFVLALLLWIIIRYNKRMNPTPSRTTHNTMLEVVWTVIPIFILVGIAVYSFKLLVYEDTQPEKIDLTIKATGNQWYWSYEYPDHGGFSYDAFMVKDEDLAGRPRLLATTAHVVVPAGATVLMQVTAADVIHSWALPAFSVKIDAVPGKLNQTWFVAEKEGLYYGQCSELCGKLHGFMPITVEVVSPERFAEWVAETQARYAGLTPEAPQQLAAVGQ